MSITVDVHLLSGKTISLEASTDASIDWLSQEAQRALAVGKGRLLNASGEVLDGETTIESAGVQSGDLLTFHVIQVRVAASKQAKQSYADGAAAFAAIIGSGSVVVWGDADFGGDSAAVERQLKDVCQIQASNSAFAAILGNGAVVTWSDSRSDSGSSAPQDLLEVQQIQASAHAFAAILGNGSVVTWGHPLHGADSQAVQTQLEDVRHIQASNCAFAAILGNGSVVTWGDALYGGDSSSVQDQLEDVQQIQASACAFAAILGNGSVVTWGHVLYGGDSSAARDLLKEVQQIQASSSAFAAIRRDRSVVTWGHPLHGGNSKAVEDHLKDARQIQASAHAFAAVLGDGSVVTWGDADYGGDSSLVQARLKDVQQIQASNCAFAAILGNGSVVTWGDPGSGGDSRAVQDQLKNVQQIQASAFAFAAILGDGSVVTWGHAGCGGDSTLVKEKLQDVHHIQAAGCAFAAILGNASVVTWGDASSGGDSGVCRISAPAANYPATSTHDVTVSSAAIYGWAIDTRPRSATDARDMLRIRAVSGESLNEIDLGSFLEMLPVETSPVRALKQHLQRRCGLSRFRQRLVYLGDDAVLADDGILSVGEVQVILLTFCPASQAQVTALRDAAGSGFTSEVENLLQRPQDPDSSSVGHPTPLLAASEQGHIEVTRLLLEANADKDTAYANGATPLYMSAQEGHLEVARLLLEANVDKDKELEDGFTPLYISAQKGHLEIAKLLLEANADTDKPGQMGATPLHIAAQRGHLEVARLLLEANADKDKALKDGTTPLCVAAQTGQLDVARLLLEAKADMNKETEAIFSSEWAFGDYTPSALEAKTDKVQHGSLKTLKRHAWGLPAVPIPLQLAALKGSEYKGAKNHPGEPKALADIGLPLDEGQPGDQYQVQLQVKGRFRSVTWERLDTRNVQRNGLPRTMGRYFIAGSWNDWRPEEMMLEDEAVGRFTIKASLPKGKQRFQILRNRDWRQLIYPETRYADCEDDVPVKGPDASGYDSYWSIEVMASRNVFFIDLELWPEAALAAREDERKARPAVSKMKVSWRSVGRQELSQQELFENARPSFFLVGSWDCWLRRTKMRFDGLRQSYVGRAPRALRGGDLFQILSNGDWNSILHPSVHEAGLENTAASRGAGTRAYPAWRMDKDEVVEEETSARRRASDRFEVVLNIRSTPWRVSWQKSSSDELDDSSDEDLDPELYGPPGADGL
ncbi:Ankyrin-1 [Symbiodinium microadriaticum]|uniref:Ankyrin-1 n=2 Tax=Symbiodinium TaxID=2949 RepID=A0A1Q9E5N5_SYMMI|nr:Ankyrin-1 [Symbiodinium microadriaticum]